MPKPFATQAEHAAQDEPAVADEPVVEEAPATQMSGELSNKLTVAAPMTMAEITCALDHYQALEAMLQRSGPQFVNARRDAARSYNRALDRLHEEEARLEGAGSPLAPMRRQLPA